MVRPKGEQTGGRRPSVSRVRAMTTVPLLLLVLAGKPFVEAPAASCEALEACEKACEAGAMPACRQLGQWLEDGEGVAADRPRALELYQKACAGKDARACLFAGALLLNDFERAGGQDAAKAKAAAKLFAKSCTG